MFKTFILSPFLTLILIYECFDGDSLEGERAGVPCNRLPFANGVRRLLNDIQAKILI